MVTDKHFFRPRAGQDSTEARRHGRLRPDLIECAFGKVLDISASGMRVQCKHDPHKSPTFELGKVMPLTIDPMGLEKIEVSIEIIWTKHTGFRRWLIGMKFVDIDDQTRMKLTQMARGVASYEGIGPFNRKVRSG